jgi:hypothetical protein
MEIWQMSLIKLGEKSFIKDYISIIREFGQFI